MNLRHGRTLPIFHLHDRCLERTRPLACGARALGLHPRQATAGDYFFQYSWMLPGIFDPRVNLRERRYFGGYRKDSATFLFDFWGSARKGCAAALQQYCELGHFSDVEVKTPLAAYHHVRKHY